MLSFASTRVACPCVCVERWAAQRVLLSLLGITAKPDVRLRAGPRKTMSYRAARINNESAVRNNPALERGHCCDPVRPWDDVYVACRTRQKEPTR
jgi:hypothetical protein